MPFFAAVMSQMAVITPKVVTETPEFGQGETEASPRPEPRAIRIKLTATITKAPPMMAPHDTADTVPAPLSVTGNSPLRSVAAVAKAIAVRLMPEECK